MRSASACSAASSVVRTSAGVPSVPLEHPLDEVRGAERAVGRGEREGERGETGALGGRDAPRLFHRGEHAALPGAGALRVAKRVVAARALRQADEERRFGRREVARPLPEVEPRRGFDAVRAVAERDAVEPEREDLPLREAEFEPEGEVRLGELVGESTVRLPAQRTRHLHRQRRGAATGAARRPVPRRPRHGERVDAGVPPERPILRRDERGDDVRRDGAERDGPAASRRGESRAAVRPRGPSRGRSGRPRRA